MKTNWTNSSFALMDLVGFFALLLVAEVLGTVGGFGSSMLVMPLAVWFLPFEEALGLTAVFHVFSNAAKMILFRRGMDRELLLRMGIPAIVGVLVGASLTSLVDGRTMSIALGVTLLAVSSFLLVVPGKRIAPTAQNAVVGGSVSGFIAGLVGTGGAIRGVTLSAFGLQKEVFVATSAWIDMGVDLSRSVVYWNAGYLKDGIWTLFPGLVLTSVVGSFIGKRVLSSLSQTHFEKVVIALVMIIGSATLIHALLN